MISDKIRQHHLDRRAILYVRQSSSHQVLHNRESRTLQYAMRERLTALGWSEIEVVDDDLGRSAAGGVMRAGFERMVAEVCLGKVGAVTAREVSRFARNSRDWQQLIEMCRVLDTVLIDQETVYAPRRLARSGRFSYRRRLESSQPVDRRWQARLAGLDLQRHDAREESHQPKIAVVEPKARLFRRLPYVPGLSRPWPMVAAQAGADAADGPEFLDDLARKDRRSLSQPSISRGIDDEVDRQFRPVAQNHAPFANGVDRDAASHGDAAIDDEFRGAHVNVEAGGILHSPREEAAAVLAKVVEEAGLAQSLV